MTDLEPVPDADAPWIEALSRGETAAVEPLLTRHGARLKSVARNLLGNTADAEDAVQETFLKAYHGAGSFRGASAVSTWLHRLLVNTCLDVLRRRRRRGEESLEGKSDTTLLASNSTDQDLRLALERSVSRLGSRRRTAFLLYAVEGFSHREIAEILEISENGSKSLLFEARKDLQRLLSEGAAEKGLR